ncbi:MAG: hypothetical protein J7M25_08970 [Deltaproteobacteria bacterium]|nr:hypothetical protein [Deltaproteobacteria bacterium]
MTSRQVTTPLLIVLLAASTGVTAGSLSGCSRVKLIPGTGIPDNKKNREVIAVVERYRRAMIRKQPGALMAMAHPNYFEHSGTPKGKDDYGYKGLLLVLRKRLHQLQSIRYSIKYRKIHWLSPIQVQIEIYVDASFQLALPSGSSKWSRYTDYNEIVLAKHKGRWLFLRGM